MFNRIQSRTLAISGAALPTWAGGPVLTPTRFLGTEKLGKLYEYMVEVMTKQSHETSELLIGCLCVRRKGSAA
ncbi:hypothetical protein [Paraburkholderia domus]|uniref:Uncharacterized protein n=1 Tax=Paraburkholderia domus TaxID=2793075 RepID=A0A9N8MMN2_9BURK|nr:hypothetical protein [Paraburkholderia domus]MBK5164871.1 hypothetical protein [Burkholderia sp. R-70211]CAE6871824.1 hypothetical protein R70211_01300 [Paraburkholderia domus]